MAALTQKLAGIEMCA